MDEIQNCTVMNATEIIKLAQKMRSAQKAYFKNRMSSDLELSRRLERQLDKEIDEFLNPQTKLNI